ncbi:MAG: hypothetical protein HYV59_08405 [Planctomycetes bacterium]|nr:hypothetical protein [Planctomycetota bacterium]
MRTKYTRDETLKELSSIINKNGICDLYNADCVNWTGESIDGEYYSEVISKELLEKDYLSKFDEIKPIPRNDYNRNHTGIIEKRTYRGEELLAKDLYKKELYYIGSIVDYQVSLKAKQTDKAGKIDLISCNQSKTAYIIELKRILKETLLKAILEITTYYHQLSKNTFLKSFEAYKNLDVNDIKKAVLLYENEASTPYREALDFANRPNLKKLIQSLNIEIFTINHDHIVKPIVL